MGGNCIADVLFYDVEVVAKQGCPLEARAGVRAGRLLKVLHGGRNIGPAMPALFSGLVGG